MGFNSAFKGLNKKRDTRIYSRDALTQFQDICFNSVSGYKLRDDKTNTKTGGLNK